MKEILLLLKHLLNRWRSCYVRMIVHSMENVSMAHAFVTSNTQLLTVRCPFIRNLKFTGIPLNTPLQVLNKPIAFSGCFFFRYFLIFRFLKERELHTLFSLSTHLLNRSVAVTKLRTGKKKADPIFWIRVMFFRFHQQWLFYRLQEDGLCDRRKRSCKKVTVFGVDFRNSTNMTCHINEFKVRNFH